MRGLLKGNTGDSVLLSIVKLFTTCSGIVSTMVLSHALSLELYGTYSQTTLVVTTATSLSALGLVDAANFFYNKSTDIDVQKKYVDTVIGLQLIAGFIAAAIVLLFSTGLVRYFNNNMLYGLLCFVAFRPMFSNMNGSLQYLQVSIGKAKSVAVRNALFSLFRLIVFIITALWLQNLKIILIGFLLFEVIITFYFSYSFAKEKFHINPIRMDFTKVYEILCYSIPMGVYLLTNTLSRDIDKMLIGGWCTTEQYAIYANCATLLPFDIVSASFLTVLIPILTRYFGRRDYISAQCLFRNYLKIGYYTSCVFTFACIILSKEMILFLYGDKYLSGIWVFLLYTIVDMIKFANMSIVLSANGRTKTLMSCSVFSLVINAVLNVVFYKLFGFIGPAIATVVVTLGLTLLLASLSAKSLQTCLRKVIDWKDLCAFAIKLLGVGIISLGVRKLFVICNMNSLFILIIIASFFMGSTFLLNYKNIKAVMKTINSLR